MINGNAQGSLDDVVIFECRLSLPKLGQRHTLGLYNRYLTRDATFNWSQIGLIALP